MTPDNTKPAIRGRLFGAGQNVHEGVMDDTLSMRRRLNEEGPFDIVVGINTKNVQTTIVHVMNVVCEGLQRHFPAMKCLVVVSDGFSEDETLPLAEFFPTPRGIKKLVATQIGGPGKGNGIRTIMEIAKEVDAHAVAFVDGDLVSIRPIWIDNLLRPIMHGLTDVTVPYYLRDKWDGVITNHLCYPFTAALYGSSVRQPIGGEYGLSRRMYEKLLAMDDLPEDFGIDIFITTTALAENFRVQEAPLGIKIHASTTGYTDPRETLSRMYLEVVGALFSMAGKYEEKWRMPDGKAPVHLSESVVSYYDRLPPRTLISEDKVMDIFHEGLEKYASVYERALPDDLHQTLLEQKNTGLSPEPWAKMVYNMAAWYVVRGQQDEDASRERVLHALGALGMGRFLGFVKTTQNMDLQEATDLIMEQAHLFQRLRPELEARLDELRGVEKESVNVQQTQQPKARK